MPLKDSIVSWYIQNIFLPKREIIDKPGFIVTTFTEDKETTYLREIFVSEMLFEEIENKVVQEYGEIGKQVLYSAGKKFGYTYAQISTFPSINMVSEKEFKDFAYFLVRYIEGMFSTKAKHSIDVENKIFEISFGDYIVCRHNGLGYIMGSGGTAGIWSYALQDASIEGIQLKCQGRGDNECKFLCSPQKIMGEKGLDCLCETNMTKLEYGEEYKAINIIRDTTYSHNSLKDLLDSGFFEYEQGMLTFNSIRFFPVESHILYILENEILRLENGEKFLFQVCMGYGRRIAKLYTGDDWVSFLADFFPALGFGDIAVLDFEQPKIASMFYPWTTFSDKSKYIIFRGMISGIISELSGVETVLGSCDSDLGEYFSITMSV